MEVHNGPRGTKAIHKRQAFFILKIVIIKKCKNLNCGYGCSFFYKTRISLARELKLEMNNKDIAEIRKQFKLDNDLLRITDIYNVYISRKAVRSFMWRATPFLS